MELEDAVARAVTALPDEMREVLVLAHYEQMAIAEIAKVIGVESTTVKSRLQRARAELRETLAAYTPGMGKR
jgi:RNA polymerase sigma-70 factor (ECF subfamily)